MNTQVLDIEKIETDLKNALKKIEKLERTVEKYRETMRTLAKFDQDL